MFQMGADTMDPVGSVLAGLAGNAVWGGGDNPPGSRLQAAPSVELVELWTSLSDHKHPSLL